MKFNPFKNQFMKIENIFTFFKIISESINYKSMILSEINGSLIV